MTVPSQSLLLSYLDRGDAYGFRCAAVLLSKYLPNHKENHIWAWICGDDEEYQCSNPNDFCYPSALRAGLVAMMLSWALTHRPFNDSLSEKTAFACFPLSQCTEDAQGVLTTENNFDKKGNKTFMSPLHLFVLLNGLKIPRNSSIRNIIDDIRQDNPFNVDSADNDKGNALIDKLHSMYCTGRTCDAKNTGTRSTVNADERKNNVVLNCAETKTSTELFQHRIRSRSASLSSLAAANAGAEYLTNKIDDHRAFTTQLKSLTSAETGNLFEKTPRNELPRKRDRFSSPDGKEVFEYFDCFEQGAKLKQNTTQLTNKAETDLSISSVSSVDSPPRSSPNTFSVNTQKKKRKKWTPAEDRAILEGLTRFSGASRYTDIFHFYQGTNVWQAGRNPTQLADHYRQCLRKRAFE